MKNKLILTILIAFTLAAFAGKAIAVGDSWISKASMPSARSDLHAAPIGGLLYVVGGNDGSGATNKLEVYDPTNDTWVTKASIPRGVYQGAVGVIDNKLYVAGGWDYPLSGIPTSELQIYDPATNTWNSGANMPILSGCSVASVISRKLYVLTACDGYSGWRKYLHVYDPDTNSWAEKTQAPNIHVYGAGGVINGKFYVIGGSDGSSISAMLDVYDPATDTWSTKASMPTARSSLASGVIDGKLYVIGGYGAGNLATLEVYDPTTNAWVTRASMPTARSSLAAGVINSQLYVVGGSANNAASAKLEVFSSSQTTGQLNTIAVSPASAFLSSGQTQQFMATGSDPDGNFVTITPTWSSSTPAVGTINPTTGLFTALAEGTTIITATSGSVSGTATVTVTYDANGNGRIDRSEAIAAVMDYFSGKITRQQAIENVMAYFSGGAPPSTQAPAPTPTSTPTPTPVPTSEPSVNQTPTATPTPAFQFNPPEVLPSARASEPYNFSFCRPQPATATSACGPFPETTDPTGGSPPYHFSLGSGVGFPPINLSLGKDGIVSGTPANATAGQTYRFSVCAVDLSANQVCREVTLYVAPAPTPAPTPTPTPQSLVAGSVVSITCQVVLLGGGIGGTVDYYDAIITGTASGPANSYFNGGQATCDSWPLCHRGENDPATTQWTDVQRVYVSRDPLANPAYNGATTNEISIGPPYPSTVILAAHTRVCPR